MIRPIFAVFVLAVGPIAAADIVPGPVEARVIGVVDGDTIEVVAATWPGQAVTTKVRLAGIDTPEIRGKCPAEKARARAAKTRAAELVENAAVRLSDIRFGKYANRVVAVVTLADGRDMGAVLLAEGLARPMAGGRRAPWCD